MGNVTSRTRRVLKGISEWLAALAGGVASLGGIFWVFYEIHLYAFYAIFALWLLCLTGVLIWLVALPLAKRWRHGADSSASH